MKSTQNSLDITREISYKIKDQTFHHHYYILYDIASTYPIDYEVKYVEIGCYAGGSACLMLQRPNTRVISIDLGVPIDENIVHENVKKLNPLNNNYNYIKGNSQDINTFNRLFEVTKEIDILFIDGDHSYGGVIKDFEIYSKIVKRGGYIIFDDYNDYQHSPQVKPAVDFIISGLGDSYNLIGTIKNTLGARPIECLDGNCFIIQKL
jgi:hypothetical protein